MDFAPVPRCYPITGSVKCIIYEICSYYVTITPIFTCMTTNTNIDNMNNKTQHCMPFPVFCRASYNFLFVSGLVKLEWAGGTERSGVIDASHSVDVI